ncbi:MAG: NifU family protein [Pseudomonadota bacterium]|nr:NifU family protein [Pseudomonadota bacterium]
MFIQTEETPNPETLKFIPGEEVLGAESSKYFKDAEAAQASPLAVSLFSIDGVESVYLASDFLTVTLKGHKWDNKKTEILSKIVNHYLSDQPIIEDGAKIDNNPELNDEISIKINDIIEEKVRPAVARDGGDIIFNKFQDGIVYITMQGSCDGCPASEMTLKNGVENLLKHFVPEVDSVVPLQNE